MGVAGLFLVAFAEFLALVQVLIYGGAIVIVILFTLMLTRIQDFENLPTTVSGRLQPLQLWECLLCWRCQLSCPM